MSLAVLLAKHQLSHLEAVLRAAAIDLDIAADLTDADLQSLGIALGDRKRLLRALAGASQAIRPDGERRMLTACFIDLAGFTALSTQLDPEELRRAVGEYQQLATRVIGEWQGAVAQYLGDGVLAYFGYPRAHEDDAERAVRATVAIVEGTGKLSVAGRPLRARCGIATGLVVVGGVVASELVAGSVAVGEAPNRAARLQGHAAPGDVVVDAATRRLLGPGVQLEELGEVAFKGFSAPVGCWRVSGTAAAPARFQAPDVSSELVGREKEAAVLRDAWRSACDGRGRSVVVSGEPGIGKSRLAGEACANASESGAASLLLQGSPHHTATDHYPLRHALEVHGARTGDPKSLEDRLAGWMAEFARLDAPSALTRAKGLAPLFEGGGTAASHALREQLVELVCDAASKRPVLVLVEDAHWIDPSTSEWLRALAAALRSRRVLLIATTRPEKTIATQLRADTEVPLEQLAPAAAHALVDRATHGNSLPRRVVDAIVQRGGGVPLYLEEIARAVVEAESRGAATVDVPETLQASLLSRFDRLGTARELLQLASVIGRSFDVDLLAALAGTDAPDVLASLDRVAQAGLVLPPREQGPREWTFKHALIRESAYSTLLLSARRELHGRLADLIAARGSGDSGRAEAAAWHLTAAGRSREAIEAWNVAGASAARRGAAGEAQQHYEQALALIRGQAAGPERDAQELAQLLKLGPLVMMARGVGVPVSIEIYERARELSLHAGTPAQRFSIAFGLWYSYEHQGRTAQQAAMLQAMREMAAASGDPREQLQVHHAEWETLLNRGELQATIRAADAGLALYDPRDRPLYLRHFGGHDPAVCALSYRGAAQWSLGQSQLARRTFDEALERATQASDLGSRLIATITLGGLCFMGREPERMLAVVPPLLEDCRRAGFATGILTLAIGWANAMLGREHDLAQMHRTVEGLRRHGVRIRLAYYELVLADTLRLHADVAGGLQQVARSRDLASTYSDATVAAKIGLVEGDLHLLAGNEERALQCWRETLDVCRRYGSVFLELDAALRIARVEERQGRSSSAAGTVEKLLLQRLDRDERGAIVEDARRWLAGKIAGQADTPSSASNRQR
ncbi:ATP-binding protein [Ramlibacter albus]|uniref:AAA family ATPase n=1 Tax=Ramlibacter albus TaxID=2079448 RepID=A0A923S663_9BURK|nr:adenylate/guanylate cyclase domain-containing protein [Ramlibacter albus]MBC5765832.1 AAA family ATPase [Ramlibacter albus]